MDPMAHLTAFSISACSYSGLHSFSPTQGKLYKGTASETQRGPRSAATQLPVHKVRDVKSHTVAYTHSAVPGPARWQETRGGDSKAVAWAAEASVRLTTMWELVGAAVPSTSAVLVASIPFTEAQPPNMTCQKVMQRS
jgi:hypothetical protein